MRTSTAALALLSITTLGLGGCMTDAGPARYSSLGPARPAVAVPPVEPVAQAEVPLQAPTSGRYASLTTEPFPVASIDTSRIPARYLRQEVAYTGSEPPNTIVIDTAARHLYFVEQGGRAIRYGVGVGKQGMSWSGTASVGAKRSWPDWYPPKEMIARRPDIQAQLSELQSGRGVAGGPRSPLGARAMYLYQDGKDTLYRIHGTLEPYTMGQAVSSGCIRMINQDVIDLFSRVDVGTRVVVLPDSSGGVPVADAGPAPAPYASSAYPSSPYAQAGYPRQDYGRRYGGGPSAWEPNDRNELYLAPRPPRDVTYEPYGRSDDYYDDQG